MSSYLADGVRGGVVVAWWFAAKPFAMLSFGGVTTFNITPIKLHLIDLPIPSLQLS